MLLPAMASEAIDALSRCRKLTPRERQVLTLCCGGLKNDVIATALRISRSAVRRHLRNLHKKTNTADKAELILNLWHSCQSEAIPRARNRALPRRARRPVSRRGRLHR